jgi:nitrogen-specific signal transduction histidine kinase/CheY-like chemotaxis protein
MSRANQTPRQLKVLRIPSAVANHDRRSHDRRAEAEPTDDLVSLGSHELRNSVSSIVGCAELIDSGDLADDALHLYTGILLREGRRLSAVVNRAVELQRLEHGDRDLDLAPVDLRSLIQRAAVAAGTDELRPIDIDVPSELPLVSAEAEAILEVLGNFISNARRFSPNGGSIEIAARQLGDMVEVDIRDHGIGIEAEVLPKLFRKFYTADSGVGRLTPGAGLGLAINHRIVEAHGGQVVASSRGAGKGARFQFTLPISRPSATSGKVLIIEDDAGFAALLKAEFAAEGLGTVRAADAETAERMLVDTTPLAIVLDLALPGLQGEDFLTRLWSVGGARLPVVILTMKNLNAAQISALEQAGATAVLPKEAGALQAAVALIAGALAMAAQTGPQ